MKAGHYTDAVTVELNGGIRAWMAASAQRPGAWSVPRRTRASALRVSSVSEVLEAIIFYNAIFLIFDV